jgi:lipopolysaccharide export system permease protein
VKRVEGHKLIRVTLSVQGAGRTSGVVITADEAELFSSPAQNVLRVVLHNGKMDFEGRASLTFSDYQEHEIQLPDATKENLSVLPSWLPLRLIPDNIDEQKREICTYQQELAARVALHVANGEFDELSNPFWPGAMSNLSSKWNHLFRLQTEEPRRWATAFSCLFFVWVGAPMAIRLRNGDFLTSFFLCFMPILVVYYPLMVYGVSGAKNGTIPPYSVWAGNVLLTLWGAYLLRKVIRY